MLLLTIFEPFIAGFAFILFVVLSLFAIYTAFTAEEEELKGFNRRWYIFSEYLFWAEVLVGIIIACIAIGSWLSGVL